METLRHLVFATDRWLARAVQLRSKPYHPPGLAWSGAGAEFCRAVGLDPAASPGLAEILPVRHQRQRSVRAALASLTEAELSQVRRAPEEPGHPRGEHRVLHCWHVVLNEEWEHHRYAVRDLDIRALEAGGTHPS